MGFFYRSKAFPRIQLPWHKGLKYEAQTPMQPQRSCARRASPGVGGPGGGRGAVIGGILPECNSGCGTAGKREGGDEVTPTLYELRRAAAAYSAPAARLSRTTRVPARMPLALPARACAGAPGEPLILGGQGRRSYTAADVMAAWWWLSGPDMTLYWLAFFFLAAVLAAAIARM